ncbi:MAG: Serine/threonine-protein kinase AfsK [Verrucomicrobia subdivision 3 bacterium]|nr:Serine/threonine-protein kinase AfsK [Limisphaerales bacterium]MCS1416676.1 Serine/threonine-protein kinase AfsK [Limisphaerales bacterium]
MKTNHFLALTGILLTPTLPALADDWTAWRGGTKQGVSNERNLPLRWSSTRGIRWQAKPAGWGNASPIIVGSQVFVTSQTDNHDLLVSALRVTDGRSLWATKIANGTGTAHQLHNMATPTPVSDGNHVWALYGTGDLACLDLQGKILWQRNLQNDYHSYDIMHGMGTSPILHNGALYIACLHQGPSYLLAIDARTGKQLWKQDRELGTTGEARDSYSTPILFQHRAATYLAISGGNYVDAYELRNGSRLWQCDGLDVPHPYGRTIAGPTFGENTIVTVASGFSNRGYTIALDLDRSDDDDNPSERWRVKRYSADCPTPVIYNGMVFMIRDDGIASCLDLETGEAHWQERVHSENVKISPVVADQRVYFLSGQANCAVVKAAKTFEILERNELNEETLSAPAISNGSIYIRTKTNLYAISSSVN